MGYKMNNIFYVYKLVDPRNGLCFYVGKGHGNRYLNHNVNNETQKRNLKLYNKIYKIKSYNLDIFYNFPYKNLEENEAYKLEKDLIDFHGLQNLCNLQSGGLGGKKGDVVSEKTKLKISKANKNPSDETRGKMSKASKGRFVSEEPRRKLSKIHRNCSKETRQKISESLKGNQRRKGIPHTEEAKRKISESHKGKHHSEETKRKMRKA